MNLKSYLKKIKENSNVNNKFYLYLLLYIIFIYIYILKKDLLILKKFSETLLMASFSTLFLGLVYFKNIRVFIYTGILFILSMMIQLIKIYI